MAAQELPRVLVVDDDPDTVHMLTGWLGRTGYAAQGVSSGLEGVAAMREAHFDVAITDLRMPGLDGLQLLTILEELAPKTAVIFLTGSGTLDDAVRALRGGRAFDFLQKPLRNLRDLNATIDAALARRPGGERPPLPSLEVFLGCGIADVAPPVADAPARGTRPAPPLAGAAMAREPGPRPPGRQPGLTETELQMLHMLAAGHDNRRIADELCFSEKTVRNYLSRAYEKLGVDSRLRAVATCRQLGLFE